MNPILAVHQFSHMCIRNIPPNKTGKATFQSQVLVTLNDGTVISFSVLHSYLWRKESIRFPDSTASGCCGKLVVTGAGYVDMLKLNI